MVKKVALTLVAGLISLVVYGQDVVGTWHGALKVQGINLRLVFHISKAGDGYTATMDSPDQGAKGIPVTTTNFESATLKMSIVSAGIEYEGVLVKDSLINGNFRQAGQSFPLTLSWTKLEELARPQEPRKPYSYYQEEVVFENKSASITLAGTLTLPKKDGVFPAVILISGSGPQNR